MTIPIGLLQWTEGTSGADLISYTQKMESLGYSELWIPEAFGREPLSTCGYLLASTTQINVSCGICNIYVRDADAAAQGANTLAEMSGGRFRLGLGVSHPVLIEPRGHQWQKPVGKMREYIAGIKAANLEAPRAAKAAPIIVAGHGKGLMRVAADGADGSFLFLQPIEAITLARDLLGPDKELHVTVRCVLDSDPDTARDLARRACAFYTSLPAYRARYLELGYTEDDFANGGSDRLIDAICVWGDVPTIQQKIQRIMDAGATHIVLYPGNPDEQYNPESAVSKQWHWTLLEALAPNNWPT